MRGEFQAEVTVTESQQDLGGGVYRIVVSLLADRNLALGSGLYSNVGHSDPFNLLRPVKMNKAVITFTGTFFVEGGQTLQTLSWNFASLIKPSNPWLGTAPSGN